MRTVAAFLLISIGAWLAPRRECGDRRWLPFEYDVAEWVCQRPAGHSGDHAGWLR